MPDAHVHGTRGGRPLRVLYDFVIFRMERRGGVSRYITELASRLGRSGEVEATVFGGVHDNEFLADRVATRGARMLGVRNSHAFARTSAGGALDYAALGAYRRFGARTDVYHPSYYPRRLARPRGARIVATVYDMIHERLPEHHVGDPTPARKRALVEAADIILCISATTARDLSAFHGVEPSRIRVTHLGGGGLTARTASGATPAVAAEWLERPYFIHVGRRAGYKNFRLLLEAYISDAELNRSAALLAVGGGDWTSEERALIAQAPAHARIVQLDVADDQLAELYRHATALVMPSLYEGFGLPAVEAMQAGCPVIANATGSLPEVIADAGLVCSMSDAGIIAKSMRAVLGSPSLSSSLRVKGRLRAARFDWATTASETLLAYRSVVGAA